MTIIASRPVTVGAHIGYRNILSDTEGAVSSSGDTIGYNKEYGYDWRTYTWWRGGMGDNWLRITFSGNRTADYFAVAAHDLSTKRSTIKLQYSADGISWSDATDATSGMLDRVIFVKFAPITSSYWRVLVSNPIGIASVGMIAFGEALDLTRQQPIGFEPPALARDNQYLTNESNTGQFLGRSIERTNYKGTIQLNLLDPAWVRAEWMRFIDHAEVKPFFYSWESTGYSNEAVFAWTDGEIPAPKYSHANMMRASIKFRGNL